MHPFERESFPFGHRQPPDDREGSVVPAASHAPSRSQEKEGVREQDDGRLYPVLLCSSEALLLSQRTYQEILAAFHVREAEAAGRLLGPKECQAVTHFCLDDAGYATPVSFTLDHQGLNRKLRPFLAAGLDCKGVIHLHPPGVRSLSLGDLAYAEKVFSNPKNKTLDRFLMPIVVDGCLIPYVIRRDGPGARLTVCYAQLMLF